MGIGHKISRAAALLALTATLWSGAETFAPETARVWAEAASPELEITVAASAENPSAFEEISLSFALTNRSGETLSSILLSAPNGETHALEETITPGETLSFTQVHTVTQAEWESGETTYRVLCTAESGRYDYPVAIALNRAAALPEVELVRRVSGRMVSGNTATLVYEVRNTGNVSVQGLTLSDTLGSFSETLDRLEVGQTHSFFNRVTLSGAAVSAPELTYSTAALPEDVFTVQLDALNVSIADEAVNLVLTAGRSMFAENTAEVVLRLTNVGNADYPNLTVYDELYGGVIADSVYLPAGEAVEVAHSYPIRENEDYCWRVSGVSKAGGTLNQLTNTVTVPLENNEGTPTLTLEASAQMTKINRRGYVSFMLTFGNVGAATAQHVELYEETQGRLTELAVVAPGEPTQVTQKLYVDSGTTFQFYAVYSDAQGHSHTVHAEPVEVSISAGGERPESADETSQNQLYAGQSMQMGSSSLFLWLLGGSCAVLLGLSVVLCVASIRARRERKQRAAARKQRLKEELGKTNPFKPIRLNSKKQGK